MPVHPVQYCCIFLAPAAWQDWTGLVRESLDSKYCEAKNYTLRRVILLIPEECNGSTVLSIYQFSFMDGGIDRVGISFPCHLLWSPLRRHMNIRNCA